MTGAEFRQLRDALGWTQVKMAAFLHVSPSAVYKWESRNTDTIGFSFAEKVGLITLFSRLPSQPNLDSLRKETNVPR